MVKLIEKISKKKNCLVAGIMSGTSLDGIDVAICRIRGCGKDTSLELVAFHSVPFTDEEKQNILKICTPTTGDVETICVMNKYLGVRFGKAVCETMELHQIPMEELDFISSHGQTIYHMPSMRATLQIGELADIAAVTGKVCVGDFRPSDMAYDGEGAPLVPFVDYTLYHHSSKNRALINIGGISNITILDQNGTMDQVEAFDMGPGNMIVDELIRMITKGKKHYDENGEFASSGQINESFLKIIVAKDSFATQLPPKTTGRELYSQQFVEHLYNEGKVLGLSDADIVATVTEYTAYSIWYAIEQYSEVMLDEIFISGGGVHNVFLMGRLEHYFGARVKRFQTMGLSDDAKEAAAFAVLGNEFLHGNFNNAKSATNANRNVVMGKLVLPS